MVRVTALYTNEVDDAFRARYEQHAELCRRVPHLEAFRAGPVIGSPRGPAQWTWMGEFTFADRDAFKQAIRSPEMAASATDAAEFAGHVEVFFADIEEAPAPADG
jgi:uncharacterized protein (TIGR02118 family)